MPLYNYKCNDCNEMFEVLEGVSMHSKEPSCNNCGSSNIEKQLSNFSFTMASGGTIKTGSSCGTGECQTGSCPLAN